MRHSPFAYIYFIIQIFKFSESFRAEPRSIEPSQTNINVGSFDRHSGTGIFDYHEVSMGYDK